MITSVWMIFTSDYWMWLNQLIASMQMHVSNVSDLICWNQLHLKRLNQVNQSWSRQSVGGNEYYHCRSVSSPQWHKVVLSANISLKTGSWWGFHPIMCSMNTVWRWKIIFCSNLAFFVQCSQCKLLLNETLTCYLKDGKVYCKSCYTRNVSSQSV